jgi:hypothetical protein
VPGSQRRDYSDVQAALDAANAELDRLATLEPIPARLEYDELDQTFREWWELNDAPTRNAFLRDQGVRAAVSPNPLPSDLFLGRPEMIFSVAAIERPGMHAILYLGDLGELLRRASDLPVTVRSRSSALATAATSARCAPRTRCCSPCRTSSASNITRGFSTRSPGT